MDFEGMHAAKYGRFDRLIIVYGLHVLSYGC